ncbi:MAG: Hsp70 family protein [Polyangiaceae bacterium]
MAVVGIDLGTTNTVTACVRGGRVQVAADDQGRRLLPSVVSFHPNGDVLVGQAAKERRVVDARNTIASVKRLIGRSWESDEIRRSRERFAFELKEGPGQGPLVVARGQEYTLPEISAFVLKRARHIAQMALAEPVDRAVITVPANFNELQRAATKVAGRVAGLDVLRIINEPTAAALAYGLGRTQRERIAVYDFGGGTFDCTLLDLSGNVFEVLATAGDTFLGGDDLDLAIAERMAEAFLGQHRYDPRSDPQAFERLRAAAEELKIALSLQDHASVRLREVGFGVHGAHLDLEFGMTRAELETMAAPLVERTLAVCQEALALANLPITAFDKAILVGGSTRIPLVRAKVEQFFGRPALDRVNPEEVVAIGAAIQASALTEVAKRQSLPPAPMPGGPRRTYPTIPPDVFPASPSPSEDENEDAITVTASVSELLRRTRQPSTAPAPSVPRTVTQRMGSDVPPPAPSSVPDPAPTLPRPIKYADVVRSTLQMNGAQPSLPAPTGQAVGKTTMRGGVEPTPSPLPPVLTRTAPLSAPPVTVPVPVPAPASVPPMGMPELPPVNAPVPVLVDVTPRALVVETAGGWCDVVVQRNAKIPCDRTRAFTTSSDNQELVRVRVAQGEDPVFGRNTFLGQVELTGLRAAPRGEVVIQVRFEVDESGTLKVFATDASTGRQANAVLQLVGLTGGPSIAEMAARHAAMRLQ